MGLAINRLLCVLIAGLGVVLTLDVLFWLTPLLTGTIVSPKPGVHLPSLLDLIVRLIAGLSSFYVARDLARPPRETFSVSQSGWPQGDAAPIFSRWD